MMALPFHPSNTYTIDELNANLEDILRTVEVEADRIAQGEVHNARQDQRRQSGWRSFSEADRPLHHGYDKERERDRKGRMPDQLQQEQKREIMR